MAWIEVHQSLPTHRKTLLAANILKVPSALIVGYLVRLWLWALDNASEGVLADDPALFNMIIGWRGRGSLLHALTEAGFLERSDGTITIHDWYDYAGKLGDQRELRRVSNKDAQARRRQRLQSAPVTGGTAGSQRLVSAENDDSQHPTLPYPTEPREEEKEPPKGGVVFTTLREWQEHIGTVSGKGKVIGVLMQMLKTHWNAPVSGDKVAGLLTQTGNDAGYAAKVLWQAMAENPAGDLVQYAMGIVSRTKRSDGREERGKFGNHPQANRNGQSAGESWAAAWRFAQEARARREGTDLPTVP